MIPENMKKLRDMLQRHEGLRLVPYQDTRGIWTMGWGHNVQAHGEPIPSIISFHDAEWLFEQDFAVACSGVEVLLHSMGITVDDVRFSALVDLCFNMGINGVKTFKKMLANLQTAKYSEASIELLNSKYATQVGKRADELAHMLSTGTWMI